MATFGDLDHASAAVLNIIFTGYPQADMLVETLYPEVFGDADHARLFSVLQGRHRRRDAMDIHLLRQDVLELGGDPYVVDTVASATLDTLGVSEYLQTMVEHAKRRSLATILGGISVSEGPIDTEFIRRQIEVDLSRIESILAPRVRSIRIGEAVSEYRNRTVRPPIKTGLKSFDDLLNGGLRHGEMTLLVAQANVGKSILGGQVAMNVSRMASYPGHVLFISAEMMIEDLVGRWMASITEMPSERYDDHRSGRLPLSPDELSHFEQGLDEISRGNLSVVDLGRSNVIGTDEIAGEVRSLNRELRQAGEKPICLVVVDYLQLLDYEIEKGQNLSTALGRVAMRLKRVAMLNDCHVITIAALRKVNGREVTMDDVRDSGEISYHVDNIISLEDVEGEDFSSLGPEWNNGDKSLRMLTSKALKIRKGAKSAIRNFVFRGEIQRMRDPYQNERQVILGSIAERKGTNKG